MIKDWIIGLLLIIIAALIGTVINHDMRITNLERQQLRIEQEYQAVITENHKLVRMNNQTLRLLTQGGWYGINNISIDSSSN